jgi:hypothetical protein
LTSFSGLLGPVNEKQSSLIFRHSQQQVLPPDRLSVRATKYRLAKEIGIYNNLNDETETAV